MADRCRERRYADHIFIQINFRMHHFVVKFSKFSLPQAAGGALTPVTKILRTFLPMHMHNCLFHCTFHETGKLSLITDVSGPSEDVSGP